MREKERLPKSIDFEWYKWWQCCAVLQDLITTRVHIKKKLRQQCVLALSLSKMAANIVSGARKERDIRGKSCCYRDRGVIVKKYFHVSDEINATSTTSMVVVGSEQEAEVVKQIIQSGFVH